MLRTFVTAYASLLVLGFCDNVRGPLFPDVLADLALSDAAGSWLFGAGSAGVIAGSYAAQPLLRRLLAPNLLRLGLVLLAAGFVVMSQAGSWWALIAGSVLTGFGHAGTALAQNLMVQQSAPARWRRRALAGLHAMYGLASLSAPLVVTAVMAGGGTWRSGLAGAALVPLGLLVMTWRLAPLPLPSAAHAGAARSSVWARYAVACVLSGMVFAELAVSTRLPLLLRRAGYEPAAANAALTWFFVGLTVGRLLCSFVAIPLSNRVLLAVCGVSSLVLLGVGLTGAFAALPWVGLTIAPCFPTTMDLLAEEFPSDVERGMGEVFATVSASLVAGQYALGVVSDARSLHTALWLAPAALCGSLVLLCLTSLQRPPSPSPR